MLSNVDDLTASRYTRDMYQYSFLRSHAGKQQNNNPPKLSTPHPSIPSLATRPTAPPLLPLTPPPSSLPSLSPTHPHPIRPNGCSPAIVLPWRWPSA